MDGGSRSPSSAPSDDDAATSPAPAPPPPPPTPAQAALPETEAYCHLVVLAKLADARDPRGIEASAAALERLSLWDGRALDAIRARTLFYLALAHERHGEASDCRGALLAAHRRASLRRDEIGQETTLNLLMRNYLHYDLYDQAEKLRSKAQLPTSRSNQQACRYLYYLGRIRAVQLEYSDAKECLSQAQRKAPKHATGFQVELAKWLVAVRLLLGEIPDARDVAVTDAKTGARVARTALAPYLDLVNAVRLGDLERFEAARATHAEAFRRDKLLNVVGRLRRNVIRTGLRRVSLAYERISLEDVARKLGLDPSDPDVERIVVKAIRDGGVDATVDAEERVMRGKATADVYGTREPQEAFHQRIAFCLDAHNEAVRAMRYPPKSKTAGDGGEAAKERNALEAEVAMLERMDDDDDAMDEF